MSKTQKGGRSPLVQKITVTLLVMGAKECSRTFYTKAAAKAYFAKWQQSVCCYPLVTVDGRALLTITAARRFCCIRGDRVIPWAETKTKKQ